ncbi:MAG: gamma-glutamyl-gamma-aminobutyrate hydrolase family protein [Elusimicrobiota bacterium]
MTVREPFIGITCDVHIPSAEPRAYELFCDHRYPDAVKEAGGFPVLLPIGRRPRIIRRYFDGIDGLIIVGGDDVDPRLYGERPKPGTGAVFPPRLRFERELYQGARLSKLPILGVCYGMQLINVLEGGTLFQDIKRDAKSKKIHQGGKGVGSRIRIDPRSRLRRILGTTSLRVLCDHHQAVSRVAPRFRPVAFAEDGIIEAIESDRAEILAVQWHPERAPGSGPTKGLFRSFVRMCARR